MSSLCKAFQQTKYEYKDLVGVSSTRELYRVDDVDIAKGHVKY